MDDECGVRDDEPGVQEDDDIGVREDDGVGVRVDELGIRVDDEVVVQEDDESRVDDIGTRRLPQRLGVDCLNDCV